jgi:hypothetical protein
MIKFDIRIKTQEGVIFAIRLKRRNHVVKMEETSWEEHSPEIENKPKETSWEESPQVYEEEVENNSKSTSWEEGPREHEKEWKTMKKKTSTRMKEIKKVLGKENPYKHRNNKENKRTYCKNCIKCSNMMKKHAMKSTKSMSKENKSDDEKAHKTTRKRERDTGENNTKNCRLKQ